MDDNKVILDLDKLTKAQLISLKMKAAIMWQEYFSEMKTKYALAYSIMSDDERKEVVKVLTDIYMEYKYNPKLADAEDMLTCYPYYRYTDNKEELHLISLSLDEVFRL